MPDNSLPKCQRIIRNVIRIVITLLALIVCAYQIYIVSRIYYSYPTTVSIQIDSSPFVHLPAVSICSELASTILVEELVKIKPTLYDVFAGKTRTEISLMLKKRSVRETLLKSLQSLPINEQHKMTVSSEKFLKQCHLPTPLGRYIRPKSKSHVVKYHSYYDVQSYNKINCSQFSQIEESISSQFKCFTLFSNRSAHLGLDINYQIPRDVVSNLKYLAWIQLNRDFMFNGLLYIHSPDIQFQHSSNVLQLDPDKHQFMTVAFERTILQSLPPPYETHCHDYRLDGYTCRDDCLTQCKTKLYLKLDGWPGDVYANKSVTQRISNVWSNNWSQTGHLEEGLDPESLSTCSDQCGRAEDCETAQYDVRTVRIREREEEDRQESHSFTVAILPPKNGNVINKHVPKLEPIEFLVYVGSLISLYLGMSVVSVGVFSVRFLTFSTKMQSSICNCGSKKEPKIDETLRPDKTIFHNLSDKM